MKQIANVQVLRGVAALTVAFGHAQYDAMVTAAAGGVAFARSFLLPWGAGVDLFFVISGFIMVLSSERLFGEAGGSRAFLGRRLSRIVPLWWLCAGAALAMQVINVRAGSGRTLPTAGEAVASFLFWPVDMFRDGFPRPFYTLGWTLDYEMVFYVLFAAFVPLPRERAAAGVVLALLVAVGLGATVPGLPTPLAFWSRPIVLEFALGIGIALAFRRGLAMSGPARLVVASLSVLILGLDGMRSGLQDADWITPNDFTRVLFWGVPAAAILAAGVLRSRDADPASPAEAGPLLRFGTALGDASYALYLTHPFVIAIGRKVWTAAGLQHAFGSWLLVALSLVAACLVALAVHRWIERPLTDALHRLLPVRPGRNRSEPVLPEPSRQG